MLQKKNEICKNYAKKFAFIRIFLYLCSVFRLYAVVLSTYFLRTIHVGYTYDIRRIILLSYYCNPSFDLEDCLDLAIRKGKAGGEPSRPRVKRRSKSLQSWQKSNQASPLTPFRANSNAMTASFSAPVTAAPTLMRSTILSTVLLPPNKPKPAPRSAWLSSKHQPSSTIPPSAPTGSVVTPPTASTIAPLHPPVTTPLSAASSLPPSIFNSSYNHILSIPLHVMQVSIIHSLSIRPNRIWTSALQSRPYRAFAVRLAVLFHRA